MMAAAMKRSIGISVSLSNKVKGFAFVCCLDLSEEDCFAVARLSDWVD